MEKIKVYLYSLICRACGHIEERRLAQFDAVPECPNCKGQLLVDNATLEKENENDNGSITKD
jgi:predicted Zn-ribbon and HTH transcriptional regulator